MTALPATTITVASYNICHGRYAEFDWKRLIAPIAGADLVGIQEVDLGTRRSNGADEVAALREALELPHTLFIPAMDYDGGQYGTLILSRFPIVRQATYTLDAAGMEPRAFGEVTVQMPNGRYLCMINTHLSYESTAMQEAQMAILAEHLTKTLPADMPVILTGDFNTEDFSLFAPLTAAGLALTNHARHRFPTFRTTRVAIDNILYDPTHLMPLAVGMPDSPASDHDPLIARFAWR